MNEISLMKLDMLKDLAILLTQKNKELSVEQALPEVFHSETYTKVMNDDTHLYYQSPRYVFAFLEEELTKGKFE